MQTQTPNELAANAAQQLSALLDLVNETPARGADAEALKPVVVAALRAFNETYETADTPALAELARDAGDVASSLAGEDLVALCNCANADGEDPTRAGTLRTAHTLLISVRGQLRAKG